MAAIRAVTLIVAEPGVVAGRLASAFGWDVSQDYGSFAEVRAGDGMLLWLNEPSDSTIDVQKGVLTTTRGQVTPHKVLPFQRPADRYFTRTSRDFFAAYIR